MMHLLLMVIFLLGVILIALEDMTHINKSAIAILMCVTLWVIVAYFGGDAMSLTHFEDKLGDTSETLFFVLGALAMVELTDTHGGFRVLTRSISTNKKRKLLWITSISTFFLSALLDNIATAVIMVAILRKIVEDRNERWKFVCMTIIAANAGGAISPIGDVTTILLWTKGNVEPIHQITSIFLPSFICMLVPLTITTLLIPRGAIFDDSLAIHKENEQLPQISRRSRYSILVITLMTMLTVPVFNDLLHLPPFLHILLGLSILWIFTDLMYNKHKNDHKPKLRHPETLKPIRLSLAKILKRLDISTILFFLGILMSVAALDVAGVLTSLGKWLELHINHTLAISFLIGIMSSFLDNVALVSATQGMYPIQETGEYMVNSDFWTFLTFCAVNGGSLLIIGSATGVTVMGMEKISFGYYLKHYSALALIGYICGGVTFMLLH